MLVQYWENSDRLLKLLTPSVVLSKVEMEESSDAVAVVATDCGLLLLLLLLHGFEKSAVFRGKDLSRMSDRSNILQLLDVSKEASDI